MNQEVLATAVSSVALFLLLTIPGFLFGRKNWLSGEQMNGISAIVVNYLSPATILNALVRMVLKLLLLPIVVGISYEFNRLVGRYDNALTRALSAPGMWLQHLTTNEPDDSMIEVGIAALTAVLPQQEGDDKW